MDAPSWISVGGGSSTNVAAPHKDMDEIIRKLRKTIDDAEKKGNQQDAELPYDVAEWTDRVLQAYIGQTKRNLNHDVTVTAAQHKDSRLLNLLEDLEKDVRGRAYTVASKLASRANTVAHDDSRRARSRSAEPPENACYAKTGLGVPEGPELTSQVKSSGSGPSTIEHSARACPESGQASDRNSITGVLFLPSRFREEN